MIQDVENAFRDVIETSISPDIQAIANEGYDDLLDFCQATQEKGVAANEALKRIVDALLLHSTFSELPDTLIADIRNVGLFIESLTIQCTGD